MVNGTDKSPASMCSFNAVLACSKAARAGVFAVQPCRASIMSLLVGSALHSHCRASAMVSLTVGILLSRRGVIMLRTTCITLHAHQHPDVHMACWVLQMRSCSTTFLDPHDPEDLYVRCYCMMPGFVKAASDLSGSSSTLFVLQWKFNKEWVSYST